MLKHSVYSFKHTPIAHTLCGSRRVNGRSGMLLEYLLIRILPGLFYSVELMSFIPHNDGMTSIGCTVEKNIPQL